MPRRPDLPCAECGQLMWRGTTSLPAGKARCLPCRRARPTVPDCRHSRMCADCGSPCYGVRCKACDTKRRIIRSDDDRRRERAVREAQAPGLTRADRDRLRERWIRQRKACAYCDRPATTVDHVLPLVRGGTNHEGNLAPCCRRCNGSKAGFTVIEWRTGKRLRQMASALPWLGKMRPEPKPKRVPTVQATLNVCPECGSLCTNKYCDSMCGTRYVARSNYRKRAGIPIDAPVKGRRLPAA